MFSTRLKIALDRKNMRPAILAYRLGVNRSTVSNYLNGKYVAKIDMIRKMAQILEVSADWLSGLDVPMIDENAPAPAEFILNEGEKALVDLFRLLGPYQQAMVLNMIEAAVNSTPRG